MKTEQIKKAYKRLRWAFDSQNINHAEKLLDLCKQEERDHRGWGPDFAKYHPSAPSVSVMGQMFVIKRVAEYVLGEKHPTGKDYLHIQKSCFYAAGIADEFGQRVREAWKDFDLKALSKLDYTTYIKAKTPKAA